MSTKDGGPAFPRLEALTTHDANASYTRRYTAENISGMTLRDWFAGQALTALIAKTPTELCCTDGPHCNQIKRIVSGAYAYADAMLAERDK